MNPNVRSHHPSSAQLETLMEFLERNPGIAKGFLRTQNARERSRRQWEELAMRLNSIGGTIKTYKQWIKYWADKKSAIKKKVAARSAARHRTGGGVEDVVMLSEFEERVVALCGGESFSIGDAHLGMQPFPENDTPSPHLSYHEVQVMQVADTDNINLLQQQSQAPTAGSPAIVFYDSNMNEHRPPDHRPPDHRPISRKLFTSSSSNMGTSQCILQNNQLQVTPPPNPHVYHPSLSPPTITLTHTPTPSPSRRGSTPVASPVVHQTAAPTYSRHAASRHAASPSRRPRTVRGSRGGSVSRQTSSVAARPPSQRRTEFSTTTERFLRVEEQQLELQRLYAQILQAFLERSAERENTLIEAVAAVGKGLQSLAEAKNKD